MKKFPILFIGESPSHTRPKGKEKLPFSGKTSYILWNEIKKFGLDRNNIYITNIVEEKLPKNVKPNDYDIERNLPRITKLIKTNNIKLVILLGKIAGKLISNEKLVKIKDIYFASTYHPSAAARNLIYKKKFSQDLKKYLKLILDETR